MGSGVALADMCIEPSRPGDDLKPVNRLGVQGPKPYFFQSFDLIKTKKINRCDTSTRGA
jgi:hypothetical protein